MNRGRGIAVVTVGALAALSINAAVAGPNGGSATGKRVTQVKTK